MSQNQQSSPDQLKYNPWWPMLKDFISFNDNHCVKWVNKGVHTNIVSYKDDLSTWTQSIYSQGIWMISPCYRVKHWEPGKSGRQKKQKMDNSSRKGKQDS